MPDPRTIANVDRAADRAKALQPHIDALEYFTSCDMAHARTDREDDYLTLLQAELELIEAAEKVTGWDLDDERQRILDEADRECSYDIEEGCYLDDDGEPILSGERGKRRGYADYLYDTRRDAALGGAL